MKTSKKNESYKNINQRYLLFIPVTAIAVALIYIAFFWGSRISVEGKLTASFDRESERALYSAESFIEGQFNALVGASYFIEDDYDYSLNRLKEFRSHNHCGKLGILKRDGILYTTENEKIDMKNSKSFDMLLGGKSIIGESFLYTDESYLLCGVPVYTGNMITGALCSLIYASDIKEAISLPDSFSYLLSDENGNIITGNGLFENASGELEDILSEENMTTYLKAANSRSMAKAEDIYEEKSIKISLYPLDINNNMLLSAISDEDFSKLTSSYFVAAPLLYVIFFIIFAIIIISAAVYTKKANSSLIGQINRFRMASNSLKVSFIIHSHESPALISYRSSSLSNLLGYTDGELELIFKNSLEPLIYSEDRSSVLKDFDDFHSSDETERRIFFRLVTKDKKIMKFSDNMSKDKKTGQIISIITAIDDIAKIYSEAEHMAKRLETLAEASACYVFDLDIKNKKLFLSENLKERLGYSIQAEDCFRQSVRDKLISPESRGELEEMITSYKKGNKTITGGITVMAASGGYIRFGVTAEIIGSIIKDEVRILAVLKEI